LVDQSIGQALNLMGRFGLLRMEVDQSIGQVLNLMGRVGLGEWRSIIRAGLKFDGQSWPFMNGGRSIGQALNLMGRVGLL
jgi:hypothetical protein